MRFLQRYIYILYTFIILKSGERRRRRPRSENIEQSAADEKKNKQLSAQNGHDGFHTKGAANILMKLRRRLKTKK